MVLPDALDQLQEDVAVEAPRFMRFSTDALACCSGMSMYFTSGVRSDGVEQASA
jgi:hypothetical protein